jgi:hypothetical protein
VARLATWPSGSGNGLQSRVPGFNSRRRLHTTPDHGARKGPVTHARVAGANPAWGSVGVPLTSDGLCRLEVVESD